MASAASTPMIATTIMSSTRVKPRLFRSLSSLSWIRMSISCFSFCLMMLRGTLLLQPAAEHRLVVVVELDGVVLAEGDRVRVLAVVVQIGHAHGDVEGARGRRNHHCGRPGNLRSPRADVACDDGVRVLHGAI